MRPLDYRCRCRGCGKTLIRSSDIPQGLTPADRVHPKPCPTCGGEVIVLSPVVERQRHERDRRARWAAA